MRSALASLSIVATSVCLFAAPAKAQTVQYNLGDLLVGFQSTTSNFDYIVDLGPYTQFITGGAFATGQPVVILSGAAFAADLAQAGLTIGNFSIFGTTSNTATPASLFGTETETTPGTQTSGQTPPSTFGFGTPFNSILTVANTFAMGTDTQNGSNPAQVDGRVVDSVIQHTAADSNPNVQSNNFTTATNSGAAFHFFNAPFSGAYDLSDPSDVLDLYQFTKSAATATLLGEFQMNNGQLLFESGPVANATLPLAVPEPTSFASVLAGAGVLAMTRRRTRRA